VGYFTKMEKYTAKDAALTVNQVCLHWLGSIPWFSTSIMTNEETEILDFYRQGISIRELSENYGHSVYMIKKFLANEPKLQPVGYIWRSLFPSNKNLNLI